MMLDFSTTYIQILEFSHSPSFQSFIPNTVLIVQLKGKSRRLKLTNKILQTLQPKWYLFPLPCMHFHSFGFLFNWTEFCLSGLLWTRCLVSGPQFLTREMVRFIVPTSQDSDGDSVSGHIWSLKMAHVIGSTQRMLYCYSQEHLKNTSIFVHKFPSFINTSSKKY